MLPMLWAEYFLRTNDPMSAVGRVQEAVERRPRDYQTLFQAARVFKMAGQDAQALEVARRALEIVAPEQREALTERLESFLGEGALSGEAPDEAAPTSPTDPALDALVGIYETRGEHARADELKRTLVRNGCATH